MIYSSGFKAILDANILYPVVIRDLLFWFAHFDLYTPLWSDTIFEELSRVMLQKGATTNQVNARIDMIEHAFPFAHVKNYSGFITNLNLPDMNDRHVLAAAIKSNADVIVTNNLKDFPSGYVSSFDIEVKSADEFALDIVDLNPDVALNAYKKMISVKKSPPLTETSGIEMLKKCGLIRTGNYLYSLL